MMGITDEIKKMTAAVFGGSDSEDFGESTESPVTESIVTEVPTTELPLEDVEEDNNSDENFVTNSPSTSSPNTSAPSTDAPDDEVTSLRAKLALMEDEISALKSTKSTQAPTTEAPIEQQDFLKDINLDDVLSEPEKFNALLNSVFQQGIIAARSDYDRRSNQLMQTMPGLISSNMQTVNELKAMSDKFYEDNPDLLKYRKNVATIFGQVVASNQDKNPTELLELTGDAVREALGIPKGQAQQTTSAPKLPKNRGNKRPTKQVSTGLTSEIDAMNQALNS